MAYSSTSCALSDEEILVRDSTKCECDASSLEYSDTEITFNERLKICCKPKYQPRKLNNKGAILVLVWNFLVTTVLYYTKYKSGTPENFCHTCFQLIPVPAGLSLLFTGWLADVCFERYKVLRCSIILMWISSLLLTTTFVVENIVTFTNYYQLVFLASLGIGYGMFQANIIQFGVDQLTDASTNEIVSFINWYCWSSISSAVVINFASECASPQYKFIAPLMLCVALSVVASSLFLCNKILIKEPVTQNPFKLIYKVLKYALKHKYPQRRSAFTYCEDDIPSRIDFGKSKYGGPFTTEQVEDVKTFFGALGLVLIVSSIFGATDEIDLRMLILDGTITDQVYTYSLSTCSYTFTFMDIYYIAVALLIPLNEIVIYPLFQRCTPTIKFRYCKIVIGFILQVVRYTIMVIFVTLSRQHYSMEVDETINNTTLPSIFYKNFESSLNNPYSTYNFRFYAIPDVISSISFIMILTGAIEFLCAQIPYSMKGVIVGLSYGSLVVFYALDKGMTKIFQTSSSLWSTDTSFSCGFWYLQIKLIFILIAVLILILLSIIYKKRKREDVLPSEHYFAERYYTKKLQQKS